MCDERKDGTYKTQEKREEEEDKSLYNGKKNEDRKARVLEFI